MSADRSRHPIVHFVGSIPLPDAETVFRTVSGAVGPAPAFACPTARPASARPGSGFCRTCSPTTRRSRSRRDVPPFKFIQWDGKVVARDPAPAREARRHARRQAVQDRLCRDGDRVVGHVRPAAAGGRHPGRGQVPDLACRRRSRRPTTTWCRRTGPSCSPALTQHFARRGREDRAGAAQRPHRAAMGRVPGGAGLGGLLRAGPGRFPDRDDRRADRRSATPCRPRSSSATTCATAARPTSTWCSRRTPGSWSRSSNAITAGVARPIQFFHMPVPKRRTDDAYFAPLERLQLARRDRALSRPRSTTTTRRATPARLAAARRHVRVDGVGTECGMARGDPARLQSRLASARAAELPT